MTTEMYIENYQLDVSAEFSSLLTFELDNIKNFASRSTTWSKTIILPGTSRNNKTFGHIFQIGQSNFYDETLDNVNYNFNASKSADTVIFQNQLQTFKGVLRLLQINITQGRVEYEVAVFGELAGLNVSLSSRLLEDLDFSAYNAVFNSTNIIASWDNAPGTGVYYPLIDYGTYSTNKNDWDVRTFRPALYVREFVDKMFTAAGYRWSSDLFDTTRFKRLVVPHNRKRLTVNTSDLLTASRSANQTVIDFSFATVGYISFPTVATTVFTPNGPPATTFTYNAADTINTTLSWTINYQWIDTGNGMKIEVLINSTVLATMNLFNTGGSTQSGAWTSSVNTPVITGDQITIKVSVVSSATNYTFIANTVTFDIKSIGDVPVPVAVGDTVVINEILPKNIRQIDFLLGLVKLFNLYVYEDRLDKRLIYLKPYIDFYSTTPTDALDWTYKLNREKAIQIKPMSEINAKIYDFKYKPDSDYYNELYRKRYGQGYGDHTFDSEFEFAQQRDSFEIVFSATPLVGYAGQLKVYSTIFKRTGPDATAIEENTDSNIRILQTLKIGSVPTWDIKDGASVLASPTSYGYAGHFDNPDLPDNDMNFGNLKELFFVLATGDLTKTQFNLYWSSYMAEITDKDSKLLTAWFYLNAKDIVNLDFSKKIYIDGVLFRLNVIKDYNMTRASDCLVELLKVNFLLYSYPPTSELEDGSFLLWSDGNYLLNNDSTKIKYA